MSKFTAKKRNPRERCFVYDEDGELIIELKRPADLSHAQAVEKFLNDNVDEIKSDPDSLPPTGFSRLSGCSARSEGSDGPEKK